METVKIILLVLLTEAVVYYLFTCLHKYNTAVWPEFKDIFNPFRSWREAERREYFKLGRRSIGNEYQHEQIEME